jgi:LAS superfamily LD-carboxypeptidase LdcB
VGSLPIILFLLGVAFLLLGWRWKSLPSQEAMTALKGLAYLKREILRVQDQIQVHILEDKAQRTSQIELREVGLREVTPQKVGYSEVEVKEFKPKAAGYSEVEFKGVKPKVAGYSEFEFKEFKPKELEFKEVEVKDFRPKEAGLSEVEVRETEHKQVELKETEGTGRSKLRVLNTKNKPNISPKYQEVLELAARGHRIPEIAQRLLLSQDAVGMVLRTQQKGKIL